MIVCHSIAQAKKEQRERERENRCWVLTAHELFTSGFTARVNWLVRERDDDSPVLFCCLKAFKLYSQAVSVKEVLMILYCLSFVCNQHKELCGGENRPSLRLRDSLII